MEQRRILTREFAACWLVSFFCSLTFFMACTCATAYVGDELSAPGWIAGLTASSFIIGDLVGKLLTGRDVDRLGKRRMAVCGMAVGTALSFLYFIVDDIVLLNIIRIFHGLTFGITTTAVNAAIAEDLPPEERGRGMGYYMLSFTIASTVGPFLAVCLQSDGRYGDIFIGGIVFSLLSMVCAMWMREDREKFAHLPVPEGHRLSDYIEPSAIPISFVVFLFYFAYSAVILFMAPFGQASGLSDAAALFFLFVSISTLVARSMLGKVYDDHGENMALIPFFVLATAGFFVLSMSTEGWHLYLSGILLGFMVAQSLAVSQAIVVKRAEKLRYAVAVSTVNIFMDLAYIISPSVSGGLIDAVGYGDTYAIMGALSIVTLIVYLAVHGIRVHYHPDKEVEG